ncbi:MAG: metal ABC transporter substrate-binding protein [Fimbriiglobus sp.]
MSLRRRLPTTAFAVALAGVAFALPLGCAKSDPVWSTATGPRVAVSFAPLYCFAANVAGPDAVVKSVLTSTGPHHADFKSTDVRLIAGADLFFINGLGLDDQLAKNMLRGAGNGRAKLVALAGKFDEKQLLAGSCHHGDGDGAHHHDHGDHDPHVWLGLDLAVAMVDTIRDELKLADPAHAAGYDARAAAYQDKLRKLKADGIDALKDKKERQFLTFHESLGYLAAGFHLEIADVIQKTPGKDPSAKELNKLVELCVKKKIRVISVEPQYSTQTSAKRLLEELAAKGVADVVLVPIDPLETANPDELSPEWYENRMRANIAALAAALK